MSDSEKTSAEVTVCTICTRFGLYDSRPRMGTDGLDGMGHKDFKTATLSQRLERRNLIRLESSYVLTLQVQLRLNKRWQPGMKPC